MITTLARTLATATRREFYVLAPALTGILNTVSSSSFCTSNIIPLAEKLRQQPTTRLLHTASTLFSREAREYANKTTEDTKELFIQIYKTIDQQLTSSHNGAHLMHYLDNTLAEQGISFYEPQSKNRLFDVGIKDIIVTNIYGLGEAKGGFAKGSQRLKDLFLNFIESPDITELVEKNLFDKTEAAGIKNLLDKTDTNTKMAQYCANLSGCQNTKDKVNGK